MSSIHVLLLSLVSPFALFFFVFFYFKNQTSKGPPPPGPRPLPIIGNLHLLGSIPNRDVARLSRTYGPIMQLRLGSTPAVFISTPSLAEQVFKSHDVAISDRCQTEAARLVSYGLNGVIFADYGPRWRTIRRLCVNSLLTPVRVDSYAQIRSEELENFVRSLREAAEARAAVDVTAKVRLMVAEMVCRVVMGRKWMEESMDGAKFSEHIEEVVRVLGLFNLNDSLPFLSCFDLQGVRRRTKTAMAKLDKFLERVVDEHISTGMKKKHRDFVDIMLDSLNDRDSGLELDRTSIKSIILDMFLGTMDTSPATIDWAFAELLRHPVAMKKAKDELNRVVGAHRAVQESDLPHLHYLGMVIKESLRLHQIAPFIFRHTKQDVDVGGYTIAGGSGVLICVWAMGRDPDLWPDSEEFVPERFRDGGVDVKGQHFELLPFGSGRRMCPGMNFAMVVVQLVVAQMVHCFDWELPSGVLASELDMTEKYGLTLPRAEHLFAIPTYRLAY